MRKGDGRHESDGLPGGPRHLQDRGERLPLRVHAQVTVSRLVARRHRRDRRSRVRGLSEKVISAGPAVLYSQRIHDQRSVRAGLPPSSGLDLPHAHPVTDHQDDRTNVLRLFSAEDKERRAANDRDEKQDLPSASPLDSAIHPSHDISPFEFCIRSAGRRGQPTTRTGSSSIRRPRGTILSARWRAPTTA